MAHMGTVDDTEQEKEKKAEKTYVKRTKLQERIDLETCVGFLLGTHERMLMKE